MRPRLAALAILLCLGGASAPGPSAAHADTCAPPRVMVVLDRSSSMRTGTIAGRSKWSLAVEALAGVLAGLETKAEVGLMTFPQPNRCGPGDLEVAPALGSRAEILDALATPPPTAGNWTPMAETLEAAAAEPSMSATDAPRYAILISDGFQWCSPYDPEARDDGIDAVGTLNAAGVTTFVVGFGAGVDAATLNQMAVVAGTARAGCDPSGATPTAAAPCYYQADNAAELVAALTAIGGAVVEEACDGADNDCDGAIDEGLQQACATKCGAGVETCVAGGWTGCDAPAAAGEICNGVDDDCDGVVDPGCECSAGAQRGCGDPVTEGACQPGVQTCAADGRWGRCEGAVGPRGEACNGVDDDCDGDTDEWSSGDWGAPGESGEAPCGPGERCEDGTCQPTTPPTPPDEGTPADDGAAVAGCACDAGGPPGPGVLLVAGVGLIAWLRRRRRT